MIERLYIDNFKTLVNFEWKPGKIALLLGSNGSGKSSVLDVLWALRALVCDQEQVRRCFPSTSRCRWDKRLDLTIELDVRVEGESFTYIITIEHSMDEPQKSRVGRETLHAGSDLLFAFEDGELHLFREGTPGASRVTGDRSRSGLGSVAPRPDNKRLTSFKKWLDEDLWLLRPDPRAMTSRTDEEADGLAPDLENFASWVRAWMTQDFSGAMQATQELKKALDGFLALQEGRRTPRLETRFLLADGGTYDVDFSDLSAGQRQLCALYFLRYAVVQAHRLVMFDEPDNYVALREIQPWLAEIVDVALSPDGPQVWFVSHHPELLNQLAPGYGTVFFRDQAGPTRIRPFTGTEGLPPAETIARGWEHE